MELKDLKSDDYYYAEYTGDGEFVIVKGTEGTRPNLYVNSERGTTSFWNRNQASAKKNIRLATPEEIHWLDCCIAKKDFVEYEIALKTFTPPPLINFQQDSEYNKILIKLLTT